MIELLKRELARISNEPKPYGGYYQFRTLLEAVKDSDTLVQACMERFMQFPIEAIRSQVGEGGPADNTLLALAELLRIRDAALLNGEYWYDVFYVMECNKDKGFTELGIADDAILPAVRYYFENNKPWRVLTPIRFCFKHALDCNEQLDEVVALFESQPPSSEFIYEVIQSGLSMLVVKGGKIHYEGEYFASDDYNSLDYLRRIRKACGLRP
ncbi:hypothetical protein FWH13_02745 [Candidatus Saccharibacteria bacterium]|nr:hypothetical protein [Candidatus Saccharibacteria bacterium]